MTAPSYLKKDERAEVGIGTMIVFIATILVAAVAAGVLINTSQKLQDKSTKTGNDAVQNVGTSLTILDVVGLRTGGTGTIDEINLYVSLAPGASPLDLDDVKLHYNDGTALEVYSKAGVVSSSAFTADWIRGAGTGSVMEPGDLVKLSLGDDAGAVFSIGLGENVGVDINLLPALGNPVGVGFTSPPSFSTSNAVDLY